MAEVFRAVYGGQISTSGPIGTVVVKRIRPELFQQKEFPIFREMFVNEAKLVKRLSHPNLARVFELCEAKDAATGVTVPFIVGEFIRGRDLWSLMRQVTDGFSGNGLPPGIAAYIIREVARGLGHAHAHGDGGRSLPIIHRDVSPENIMISDQGEIKVIDFGVAKAVGGFGPQTRTGIIKGKLAYMAPEQVAQRAVPATDVFGAGIVLHELLTGRRLFGGKNEFLVVQRVLSSVIPPPSLRASVPPELDEVTMRALDRRLDHRFRDGNELAEALTDLLERLPALGGTDAGALVEWLRQVDRACPPKPDEPENGEKTGESDLHVDLGQAAKTPREAVNLGEHLVLGPVAGTIDPGVHAAVTQAMKTLTPEMLQRAQAGAGEPQPLGPRGQGTVRMAIVSAEHPVDRERTVQSPRRRARRVRAVVGTLLAVLVALAVLWTWLRL